MNANSQLKLKSKWIPATIVLIVVSMTTVMLEPAAFAESGDEARTSDENVAKKDVVAAPLPNRPVIVATTAVAPPQAQTRTLATPTTAAAKAPAKPQSTGKSRKWIFIVAAVGGGAAAAFLLKGGTQPPETATITVGSPTVGGPQ